MYLETLCMIYITYPGFSQWTWRHYVYCTSTTLIVASVPGDTMNDIHHLPSKLWKFVIICCWYNYFAYNCIRPYSGHPSHIGVQDHTFSKCLNWTWQDWAFQTEIFHSQEIWGPWIWYHSDNVEKLRYHYYRTSVKAYNYIREVQNCDSPHFYMYWTS